MQSPLIDEMRVLLIGMHGKPWASINRTADGIRVYAVPAARTHHFTYQLSSDDRCARIHMHMRATKPWNVTLTRARDGCYVRWETYNVSNQRKMPTASENVPALTSFCDRHAPSMSRIWASRLLLAGSRHVTCHVDSTFRSRDHVYILPDWHR